MKKIILLSASALFMLIGCSGKSGNKEIKARFVNSNFEKLVLEELSPSGIIAKDSATLDGKGEFKLNNPAKEPAFYRLRLDKNNFIVMILDSTENVSIEGDMKDYNFSAKIKGSKQTELLSELNNQLKQNYREKDSLQTVFQNSQNLPNRDSINAVLQAEYERMTTRQNDYIKSFIDKHPESLAGLAAIDQLDAEKDYAYYKKLDDNLTKHMPNSAYTKSFHARVAEMGKLAVGSLAPEITLNTPDGKPVSLSSLRGKIVMIDFWASWCRPCRMENPNVVKLYNQYKDKGFEVFGVSLDQSKDAWVKAIAQDNLTWTHVSDLAYWNSSVVKLYNISGIPQTYLLDKEGKIIGKGLRGEQLAEKLKELFGN